MFQVASSLRFPHENPVWTSPLPPYVPHVLPVSVFLIWSPEWYLVRSREHKVPRHVVFSITSSPLDPNILVSTPFSETFSLSCSLNVRVQVMRYRSCYLLWVLRSRFLLFHESTRLKRTRATHLCQVPGGNLLLYKNVLYLLALACSGAKHQWQAACILRRRGSAFIALTMLCVHENCH